MLNDHESAAETLNFLDSDVTMHSICDCIRLGKYNKSSNRPLLVGLSRACEVMLALSQSNKLSKRPGISIKPDVSPEERSTQSLLLKERKTLTASGTNQKNIKLLGNALFVNKQKYRII